MLCTCVWSWWSRSHSARRHCNSDTDWALQSVRVQLLDVAACEARQLDYSRIKRVYGSHIPSQMVSELAQVFVVQRAPIVPSRPDLASKLTLAPKLKAVLKTTVPWMTFRPLCLTSFRALCLLIYLGGQTWRQGRCEVGSERMKDR